MKKWMASAAACALVSVAAAGCGSSSDGSSTTSKAGGAGGTLKMATITGVLPYESLGADGKTVEGFEPDLMREVARRLGKKAQFTITEFDSLLPGVNSGRFDIVFAGMVDKAEREQAYDGINLTNDKYSWVAKSALAATTRSFDDMCGRKVGILSGSAYVAATEAASARCAAAGKPKFKTLSFDADAQGFLALKSGQIDYYPNNLPLLVRFAKQYPKFAAVGFTMLPGPTAIWLKKGSALSGPVQKALQSMMDDGSYAKILDRWGVGDIAIKTTYVNPVTTGKVTPLAG